MLIRILQRRPLLTLFLSFVCSLFGLQGIHAQHIVINEYMASNGTVFADEDGDYEDWIELYNADSISVNLGNWSITDDPSRLRRWVFPNVILNPGDFLVFFASGKNRKEGPYFHTNFSISASGEPLILSNPSGTIIDQHKAIPIPRDVSYGRMPDGGSDLTFFYKPTPGFSNLLGNTGLGPQRLTFTHTSGFYTDSFYLKLVTELPNNTQVYYTLDGSQPSPNNTLLGDSVLVFDLSNMPNRFSEIRTTPLELRSPARPWKAPDEVVSKIWIMQCAAFRGDTLVSDITPLVFVFLDSLQKQLPIISIILDSMSLFSYDTGIYVPGKQHDLDPNNSWWAGSGNYHMRGREWERQAHLAMFEPTGDLVLDQNLGIRIHGASSRVYPIKSLRLYPRSVYGENRLRYPFFKDRDFAAYNRIILRNAGNDFESLYLRDAFTHDMATGLNFEKQSVRPVLVFLNGEYWGVHYARDHVGVDFLQYGALQGHLNTSNLDLFKYRTQPIPDIEAGSFDHFQSQIIDYIDNHADDLNNPSVFAHLQEVIDIDNYLDYNVFKMVWGIYDWPGNNVMIWRQRDEGSPYRWISIDNDDALLRPKLNSLRHATREGFNHWPNPDFSTHLFRHLLQIDSFKIQFVNRFEHLLLNHFTVSHFDSLFAIYEAFLSTQMQRHIDRWNYPNSFEQWTEDLYEFREAFIIRRCYLREMMYDFFDLLPSQYMSGVCDQVGARNTLKQQNWVVYPNPAQGYVHLQSLDSDMMSKISRIKLASLSGRQMHSWQQSDWEHSSDQTIRLNLPDIAAGIYFLTIETANSVYAQKIVVQ